MLFKLSGKYTFVVPAIVKYEILRGDKKKDKFWNTFFDKVTVLSFDDKCSQIAAEIYKKLRLENNLIGTDDILIAATAISNNMKLATLNVKDYKKISDIAIITNS